MVNPKLVAKCLKGGSIHPKLRKFRDSAKKHAVSIVNKALGGSSVASIKHVNRKPLKFLL